MLQALPAAGRKSGWSWRLVKIAMQLGLASEADAEPVFAPPNQNESSPIDDRLYRSHCGVDEWLELRADQSRDPPALTS